jgi:NTE family protein
VFVEGDRGQLRHRSHAIDYVRTRLEDDHIRASAAIPILFPPVRVEHPREARGWYFDGGTRLNTPIKPALDLGAEKLIVVATDSVAEPTVRYGRHESEPPDFGDGALHVLQGMLVDPVVEDMRILGNINMFFAGEEDGAVPKRGRNGASGRRGASAPGRASEAAVRYRKARGKSPYRVVPYIFVAPDKRGSIGRLASEVFNERYGGLKGLRSPDFPFLNRLLGGESPTHGELLSYLFFDQDFIEELIRMGRNDARRWLRAEPGPDQPWQIGPLDAFMGSSAGGRRVAPVARTA